MSRIGVLGPRTGAPGFGVKNLVTLIRFSITRSQTLMMSPLVRNKL